MTTIINIDRLKIYRNYGGDIDGFLRMNKKSDLEAFGSDLDNIWGKITSFSQDIVLIENGFYFYAFHGIGLAARFKDKIPDFAFAGDYYVPKDLLEKHDITDDCRVNTRVIYVDDKMK